MRLKEWLLLYLFASPIGYWQVKKAEFKPLLRFGLKVCFSIKVGVDLLFLLFLLVGLVDDGVKKGNNSVIIFSITGILIYFLLCFFAYVWVINRTDNTLKKVIEREKIVIENGNYSRLNNFIYGRISMPILVALVGIMLIGYLVTNFYTYIIVAIIIGIIIKIVLDKKEVVYKAKIDLENELEEMRVEIDEKIREKNQEIIYRNRELSRLESKIEEAIKVENVASEIVSLRKVVSNKKELIEEIEKRIKFLNENKNLMESEDFINFSGSYTGYEYDFEESFIYQNKLKEIKEQEKELIKEGKVLSLKLNNKEDKDLKKLVVRGFNGECDSVYSALKYSNFDKSLDKIKKSFFEINRLCQYLGFSINEEFLKLKIQELYLIHGYQEKKQQELEEQRQIKEQMREEEKARREYEKAIKDAELEELRNQRALEKARREYEEIMSTKSEEEREKYAEQIAELERRLEEAHQLKERAVSQAQLTRSGHVYIISNIGSFGENVYKIGMTRRLDPLDRVKELGDASVPFPFDVHAMIYSEDAPGLESKLHKEFISDSVNLINMRKEFFNVELDKVESFVKEHHGDFKLTKLAEASQYRDTIEMRKQHVIPEYSAENEDFDLEDSRLQ